MKRLLIGVVVGLLLATPAHASIAPSWEAPALRASQHFWGIDPWCGPPNVVYRTLDEGKGGEPQEITCSVVIDPAHAWTWRSYCVAVTHETGHLLGHGHEPGGVMAPQPVYNSVPRCNPQPRIGVVYAGGASAAPYFRRAIARRKAGSYGMAVGALRLRHRHTQRRGEQVHRDVVN